MITEFSTDFKIPYDLRFMPLVQDYVQKITTLAGGSGKEANALNLAVDETMTFLINSYSNPEAWERIKVGGGKVAYTVGSALDIFGGKSLKYTELVKFEQD